MGRKNSPGSLWVLRIDYKVYLVGPRGSLESIIKYIPWVPVGRKSSRIPKELRMHALEYKTEAMGA